MLQGFALLCLGVGLCLGTALRAQTAEFLVSQNGQSVGTASFDIRAGAGGFDSSSSVKIEMQGLDYAISKTERLDEAHHLQHVVLSGVLNGSAVSVVGKPDGAQFLLNMSANGRSTTARLDSHGGAVFMADFDPGALQTLLDLAAAQNGRELFAILPKQAGSVVPVELATYADEQGTMDGKPVTVHHLQANYGGGHADLFAGPDNALMQAELPQEGFALVRKGFVLTPPKKPVVPANSDQWSVISDRWSVVRDFGRRRRRRTTPTGS
ncbi:MAG TPA: hypothetical protein VG267_15300 [Terracidiphilus sp.]|nr:hypothetical protein [Terracidiphilus sp.]